jgi:sensor histidine kinase YesM
MKTTLTFNRIYLWHVLFWTFFLGYKIAFEHIRVTSVTDSVDTFFVFNIHITNFYYILFCLKTWGKRNVLVSFLLLFLGYAGYLLFFRLYCKILIQSIGHGLYYSYQGWVDLLIDGSDLYIQFFFYAFGFWFLSRNYKIQETLSQSKIENATLHAANLELQNKSLKLENDNLQLRHQNLQNEFNYLKAQINPHFLYNTLSYFYTETEEVKPQVAKGVGLLIDIMRYSLHRDELDGNAPLEQEVQHLDNFIELLQLRFNNTLNIQFSKEGNVGGWRIPPHLLITLVENAIKHGITTEEENPVAIKMLCAPQKFQFSVKNKINPARKNYPDTGMGLQNVIKRLEMEYGSNAQLEYSKSEDFFSVHLNIHLIRNTEVRLGN